VVSEADSPLPGSVRVVIVGGGVMGCGLAYHLAREGWTDCLLLEKAELTSGSTWHAAGQITHSTSSFSLGKCVDYNIGLYNGELEKETGQSVTWHGCGSLRLAYTSDEMDWLLQTMSVGRALGFPMEIVTPARIRELHPFYRLEGVQGALHTPDDGHVDPSGVTQALAKGARSRGARILRRTAATDIKQLASGEWRVSTANGDIDCEHVVNAAGTYARQIGEWSQLQLPMTSMTHHYFVTENVPEFQTLDAELPVVRDDREVSGYIRMEQQAGLIGIYEKENPNPVWVDHCPMEAENELFAPDYERIMPWLEKAMQRMPVLAELGIKREVHGAISHPPDGNPLIGPVADARNYWCCCGTQIGIGWGPGLTRELARWMVHGAADISTREFDPRRFGSYANKDWQVIKAREDYCLRHEIPFPHFNRLEGRPLKTSPLYQRLLNKGAVYEEVYGHERPRWFATGDVSQHDHYSFRRNVVHDIVAQEVRAVRERVGIMDISAFAKIELCGETAAELLANLVPNRLPRKNGGIVLAHLLNRRGRIELETTIVRLSDSRFYLVCAAFFEQRLIDYLNQYVTAKGVQIINRSDSFGALAIQGPFARPVLAGTTSAPLDNANFRWMSASKIDLAGHSVWAFRMSYAGESGYEIHTLREHLLSVYDALWAAGKPHGIADYGSFAMNSLRMEKGFKGASELTNEVTLVEADVMRFVKMNEHTFIGKEKTQQSLDSELPWLCVYLHVSAGGDSDGHGGEAVLYNGQRVGSISSIAYGHSVDKLVAFAYVKPVAAEPGTELEVLIMNERRSATVLAEPVHDPQSLRPRGLSVID